MMLEPDRPADSRLSHICQRMVDVLEAAPDTGDVRAILLLEDDDGGFSGIVGYESSEQMLAALMAHLKAVFSSQGVELDLMAMPEPRGEG